MTRPGAGDSSEVDEEQLQRRLDQAREHVVEQRARLRSARRRLREVEAAASARSDQATAGLLRARGHASPQPPIPTHLPGWLDDEPSDPPGPGGV